MFREEEILPEIIVGRDKEWIRVLVMMTFDMCTAKCCLVESWGRAVRAGSEIC